MYCLMFQFCIQFQLFLFLLFLVYIQRNFRVVAIASVCFVVVAAVLTTYKMLSAMSAFFEHVKPPHILLFLLFLSFSYVLCTLIVKLLKFCNFVILLWRRFHFHCNTHSKCAKKNCCLVAYENAK